MWIKRDFLENFNYKNCLEAIYLRGPRQIGKSSLLLRLIPDKASLINMDDLGVRQKAQKDPLFLLQQSTFPILIDEAHLAPEIFYAVKNIIDEKRRLRLEKNIPTVPASFRLTGSNQQQIEENLQETLAGRISIFYLHGLSCNELYQHKSDIILPEIFFRGGFPELWVREELSPIQYLNDYISTYIEKDLARSAGIEKRNEFLLVLKLLAARVGEIMNYESLGNEAGIKGKTVKEWISLLEQNKIIYVLHPYFSNLNKRLIKSPKIYFLDTGLCTRLQSHQDQKSIIFSQQAGHLFENLVISETIKTRDNFLQDWNVHFWRTKEKEEIDLVIEEPDRINLIEIKMASSASKSFLVPKEFLDMKKKIRKCVVVGSGMRGKVDKDTDQIPLSEYCKYLLEK